MSETRQEKALRLVEEHRVILDPRTPDRALVIGDTGRYVVTATRSGVTCTCPARRCSHVLAAQVAWAERDSTPSGFADLIAQATT